MSRTHITLGITLKLNLICVRFGNNHQKDLKEIHKSE